MLVSQEAHQLNSVDLRHCEVQTDQIWRSRPYTLLEHFRIRSRKHLVPARLGNALDQCRDRWLIIDNNERSIPHTTLN